MDVLNRNNHRAKESTGIKAYILPVFIFVFILLFLLQNYLYIKADTALTGSDGHLFRSLLYYDTLVGGNGNQLSSVPFPPLVYLWLIPFHRAAGFSMEAGRIGVSLFAVVFLLAMFGIGKELGDDYSGVAVMALAAASPQVLRYSRMLSLDFPQAALTAAAFYFLLKADDFRNRKVSILSAVSLALSFMAKWATGFFLLIPLLWYFIPMLKRMRKSIYPLSVLLSGLIIMGTGTWWLFSRANSFDTSSHPLQAFYYTMFIFIPALAGVFLILRWEKNKNGESGYRLSESYKAANFALMSFLFMILASPWFYWAAGSVKMKFLGEIGNPHILERNWWAISLFFRTVFNFYPVFLLLPIIGLVMMVVFRKDRFYPRLLLPVNILFVSLFMLRYGFPVDRYLISLIIFITALGGYWLMYAGKARLAATALILATSLASVFAWTIIPSPPGIFQPFRSFRNEPHGVGLLCTMPPEKGNIDLKEAVRQLDSGTGNTWKPLLIFQMKNFNPDLFEYLPPEAYGAGKRINPSLHIFWPAYREKKVEGWKYLTPLLHPGDISDGLERKIREGQDPLSARIKELIAPAKREEFLNSSTDKTREILAEALNKLLKGPPIQNLTSIPSAEIRGEIKELLHRNPRDYKLVYLNRRLLEKVEIYREEIGEFKWGGWLTIMKNVDNVLIFHTAGESPEPVIEECRLIFPKRRLGIKTFSPGNNLFITIVKTLRE